MLKKKNPTVLCMSCPYLYYIYKFILNKMAFHTEQPASSADKAEPLGGAALYW